MTAPRRTGPGRPPAGRRPDERVSEYPRLAVRVPALTLDRLVALAEVSGLPQWRVLADAVDTYINQLPDDQRALLIRMLERAEPLLGQPVRSPHAKVVRDITVLNVDDN